MRVLVVEDEEYLAEAIATGLRREAMAVDVVGDGASALEHVATNDYDILVLDRDLPVIHGDEVCRRVVSEHPRTRVLMLTASRALEARVGGFELGADDYLTKPFMHEEVVVRLRALVRRAYGHADPVLQVGPLSYDTLQGRFSMDGRRLAFTAQEERILAYLMHQPGVVLSRSDIVEHVYARDSDPDSNALDVLIGRIRRKLGVSMIRTVRGRGFVLAEPEGNDAGGDDDDDVSVDPAP